MPLLQAGDEELIAFCTFTRRVTMQKYQAPHVIIEVKMHKTVDQCFLQKIRTKISVFWHKFVEESFLQTYASMWWFFAIHSHLALLLQLPSPRMMLFIPP